MNRTFLLASIMAISACAPSLDPNLELIALRTLFFVASTDLYWMLGK